MSSPSQGPACCTFTPCSTQVHTSHAHLYVHTSHPTAGTGITDKFSIVFYFFIFYFFPFSSQIVQDNATTTPPSTCPPMHAGHTARPLLPPGCTTLPQVLQPVGPIDLHSFNMCGTNMRHIEACRLCMASTCATPTHHPRHARL
jgi:hypothetical protein